METEFQRFRVDPAVREQAAQVCGRLGLELSDVLRALVACIAADGAIPFAMPTEAPPFRTTVPVTHPDRLWTPLRSQVEADVALALLARFIADCSTQLDDQGNLSDREQITRLTEQRQEARQLRRALDVTDPAAVRAVLHKYGPLMRSSKT